ncbi:putative quinol monooxygenase [Pseudarthrobacter siccitolerans]|nr:putative quinol monooxygenase [Pseudarthrobacter siccitolerans]
MRRCGDTRWKDAGTCGSSRTSKTHPAAALHSLQMLSRQDPGCLEYTVFSDGQQPGTFVLFEGWASNGDLEAHNEEDHVKEFVEAVEPLLVVPFSVTPLMPLDASSS